MKPPDSFYRNSEKADGRQTACKACQDAARVIRGLDRAHEADLRRKRYEADTTAIRAYHREWDAAHREQSRARAKRWHAENRERSLASGRRYREENPERVRKSTRAYIERNPAWVRELKQRRRVRQAGASIAPITPATLAAKWNYWAACCWMCGGEAVEWDHVKPISKGGAHCLANMRPACRSCNARKHATWPWPTTKPM